MGEKRNAFYSNSFLVFIMRFFPSLASLLVMIYYSRVLPREDYGRYNNFWIQLNIIYPIICVGLHVLLVTYKESTLKIWLGQVKARQVAIYAGWALLVGGIFAGLQVATLPVWVTLPFAIVFAVSFILESVLMVAGRFGVLVITNIAYSIAFFAAHYFAAQRAFSVGNLFSILLSIIILKLIIYSVYSVKIFQHTAGSFNSEQGNTGSIKKLWIHLAIYDVVQSASTWVDKFAISILLPAAVSAVYYNGSMNIPFIPLFLGAAGSATLIQLAKVDTIDVKIHLVALQHKSGRLLSAIVFPVFFYLLFYNREVFLGLFPKYEAALPVFVASLFILPIRAYNFTSALQSLHRGDIINKGAIGEIVIALAIMYPLYLWLGLPGVALSFVVSTYLQGSYYILVTAGILGVPVTALLPLMNWSGKFLLSGVLLFAAHYALKTYFGDLVSAVLGVAVMAVLILVQLAMEVRKGKAN